MAWNLGPAPTVTPGGRVSIIVRWARKGFGVRGSKGERGRSKGIGIGDKGWCGSKISGKKEEGARIKE